MVLSTKSARLISLADLDTTKPQGPHCRLQIAEFESCPNSVDQFTGMLRLGSCYQRFTIWAAGDRFIDMCQAKDLGFPGWSFVGDTDHAEVAA